jgi:hypothetical protein
LQQLSDNQYSSLKITATLSDFHINSEETVELYDMHQSSFLYIILQSAFLKGEFNDDRDHISCLQSFLKALSPNEAFQSTYTYLNILDQTADNRETISDVLSMLQQEFKVGVEREYLVVAGDVKTCISICNASSMIMGKNSPGLLDDLQTYRLGKRFFTNH